MARNQKKQKKYNNDKLFGNVPPGAGETAKSGEVQKGFLKVFFFYYYSFHQPYS